MSITWVTPASCPSQTAVFLAKAIGKPAGARKAALYRVAAYKSGEFAVIPVGTRAAKRLRPRNIIGTYAPTDELYTLSRRIAEDLSA